MKRLIPLMLILFLIVIGIPAFAEALPWAGGTPIDDNPQAIDLDGDGDAETIWLETVPDDFESFQRLHVVEANGTEDFYDMEIISGATACTGDMNRDGFLEIFVWGDIMSDDYYTWCLHYNGEYLIPVLFADTRRGENGDGYYKAGYGMLTDVSPECTITLCGSQDMLGTYFMERTLSLTVEGLFELTDDGRWVRDIEGLDLGNDEFWDGYSVLTPIAAVPTADGAPIQPGEKFIITGTDKQTEASFLTQTGRTGTLNISDDYERGWGWRIDDIPEDELFEYIPYAD